MSPNNSIEEYVNSGVFPWFCLITSFLFSLCILILFSPLIRHFLFSSSIFSTSVKGTIKELIIEGRRTSTGTSGGRTSGPALIGPPKWTSDFRVYFSGEYSYQGKTYPLESPSLYSEDIKLPGVPNYRNHRFLFDNTIERIRIFAPNVSYKYFHRYDANYSIDMIREEMEKYPPGKKEVDIPISVLKLHPAWNYYNFIFPDGITKDSFLGMAVSFPIMLGVPLAIIIALFAYHQPVLEGFKSHRYFLISGSLLSMILMILFSLTDRSLSSKESYTDILLSTEIHSDSP